jgi:hypothetical protein
VEAAAKQSGISLITLRRAKASLNVIAEKVGFAKESCWKWRLPDAPKEPQNACKE